MIFTSKTFKQGCDWINHTKSNMKKNFSLVIKERFRGKLASAMDKHI